MRAVVIPRFGGPEVLEVRDVADVRASDREVLVRVRASALNRADLLQRAGNYPPPPGAPSDIPGLEFAGEVVALGDGADRWSLGDRVFGIAGGGAHAELIAAHQDAVARVPDALSWEEAGGVPEVFITAHDAMVTQAGLRAGESVLVHAVGSGVGLAAIQLARARGARPFGTARTPDKIDRARALGLEGGIALSGDFAALEAAAKEWSRDGFDVVLDLVGGPYLDASVRVAALKGRIMLIGTMGGGTAPVTLGQILRKRLTIRGTVLRARSLGEKIEATRAFERDVVPLLANGRVRSIVDRVFPLDRVADAHAYLASNESFGKVVLTVG